MIMVALLIVYIAAEHVTSRVGNLVSKTGVHPLFSVSCNLDAIECDSNGLCYTCLYASPSFEMCVIMGLTVKVPATQNLLDHVALKCKHFIAPINLHGLVPWPALGLGLVLQPKVNTPTNLYIYLYKDFKNSGQHAAPGGKGCLPIWYLLHHVIYRREVPDNTQYTWAGMLSIAYTMCVKCIYTCALYKQCYKFTISTRS